MNSYIFSTVHFLLIPSYTSFCVILICKCASKKKKIARRTLKKAKTDETLLSSYCKIKNEPVCNMKYNLNRKGEK